MPDSAGEAIEDPMFVFEHVKFRRDYLKHEFIRK